MVKPPLRTKSIGFKVSEEEYAQLETAAQADGRTLGERKFCGRMLSRPQPTTAWKRRGRTTTITEASEREKVNPFNLGFNDHALRAAGGQESPVDVCDVLKSAKQFDGKFVVVSGFIYAGGHSEGIGGDRCSQGLTISYDMGSMPQDFVSAITDKRLRLDLRPLKVTVKGRFRRRVPAPLGYVSRIEISKALSWEFVGEKTTPDSDK